MSWLNKIRSFFQPPRSDQNFWFYVKCDHCHEILKGRVDMFNNLSVEYDNEHQGSTYFCRKVMIGSNRCYKPIEVKFTFDSSKKLLDRQISGGIFVTEEEYRNAQDRAS
jgi:hypothetical protein